MSFFCVMVRCLENVEVVMLSLVVILFLFVCCGWLKQFILWVVFSILCWWLVSWLCLINMRFCDLLVDDWSSWCMFIDFDDFWRVVIMLWSVFMFGVWNVRNSVLLCVCMFMIGQLNVLMCLQGQLMLFLWLNWQMFLLLYLNNFFIFFGILVLLLKMNFLMIDLCLLGVMFCESVQFEVLFLEMVVIGQLFGFVIFNFVLMFVVFVIRVCSFFSF